MNKSNLMSVYNKAKSAARKGSLEAGRLNRAFGIMQSGGTSKINPEYQASIDHCKCQDARRGNICKHRIACMIEFRMIYPHAPLAEMSDGRYWCAEQFAGRYDVHIFDTVDCFKVWKPAASSKIVMVHNVTGRRGYTEQHYEADYALPVMPPTMAICRMLESELGE